MSKQKYGLITDVEKFNESGGTEGVAEGEQSASAKAAEAQALIDAGAEGDSAAKLKAQALIDEAAAAASGEGDEAAKAAAQKIIDDAAAANQEINILETEEYLGLQNKYNELEGKFNNIQPLNPKFKEIEEWSTRTGRPLEDWSKFQADVSGMSDLDVLRVTQAQQRPNLNKAELDFHISDSYLPSELDSDDDAQRKQIAFKDVVYKGREAMEADRLVFDTVSKFNLNEEQKVDIAYAATSRAEAKQSTDNRAAYTKAMTELLPTANTISLNLTDKNSIKFNVPVDSIKSQLEYLEKMERWQNADGSQNYEAYLNDSYKIRHFDEIIQLAYEQGGNDQLESGAEESRNIIDPNKETLIPSEKKYGMIASQPNKRYQV